mmetsp:Transcript_31567/g.76216  ORF Transcript_31567/g.76216 Transcript_31567/m.76216 type:complete len:309 (+) Transcript_31567:2678-3604(+)
MPMRKNTLNPSRPLCNVCRPFLTAIQSTPLSPRHSLNRNAFCNSVWLGLTILVLIDSIEDGESNTLRHWDPTVDAFTFGPHMNHSVVHYCLEFGQVFANAVTGFPRGSAVGGSDFNPLDQVGRRTIQRFCQSYMTELANYVGSDQDFPWMGRGVGQKERNGIHVWSIQGNYLTNAEQLFDMKVFIHFILTTIPITSTLTDASGHVYEPDGITEHKLSTIDHMKDERGAPLGRYTMSSTTAQFNKPKACLIFHAMSSFVVEICTKLMRLLSMQSPIWDASSSWKAVKYMSLQPPASSSRIEVIYMQLIP